MPTIGRASVDVDADVRGFARDAERQLNREIRKVNVDTRKIDTDVDRNTTRAFGTAALNGLTQFGIVMQGGISRQAAGVFGLAVLAALLPVVTIVGAAAAGALILAFGGAIAGIGIFAAAQAEEVQEAFSEMADEVKKIFTDIAEPFEDVLISIAGIARRTIDVFVKPLEGAFAAMAPVIESFADNLGRAFETLAPTIEPITDAFIELLEELGPQLADEIFPDLADAIINLANAVGDNADTITDIIGWFLSAAEASINFLAELARLAGWFADNPAAIAAVMGGVAAIFIGLFVLMGGSVLAFIAIVAILTIAFFTFRDDIANIWRIIVTTVGGAINTVIEFFGRLGAQAREVGAAVGRWFANMGSNISKVFRNIGGFVTNLGRNIRNGFNNVVSFVKSLPGRIASAARGLFDSIWNNFRSVINRIISGWNNLSFTLPSFGGWNVGGKQIIPSFSGPTLGTPNIPHLQNGGVIDQAGAVRVGEVGPENLFLPQGAVVSPLPSGGESAMMLEGNLFLDSGEFLGVVRGEITDSNRRTRRSAMSGSGRLVGRVA